MARSPKTNSEAPTPPAPAVTKSPRVDAIQEGQPVRAMAYAKVKGGYAVILVTIEDWRVTNAEVLTQNTEGGPVVPEAEAQDVFRVEAVRRLLWPNAEDLDLN